MKKLTEKDFELAVMLKPYYFAWKKRGSKFHKPYYEKALKATHLVGYYATGVHLNKTYSVIYENFKKVNGFRLNPEKYQKILERYI